MRSRSPLRRTAVADTPLRVCMRSATRSSDGCGMVYPQNSVSGLPRGV
jgi:hypothetical protein